MWTVALALWGCRADEPPPQAVGRPVAHRLNRAEYDNTVRDLFGTSLRPGRDLPPDDFGYGFDNIAAVLSTSPLHVELYERAADTLLDELFAVGLEPPSLWTFQAEDPSQVTASVGAIHDAIAWNLWAEGTLTASVWLDHEGAYTFAARVFGQPGGDTLPQLAMHIDGDEVVVYDIVATEAAPERVEVEVQLSSGLHHLEVAFDNDHRDPALGEDRNVVVDWLELSGPHDLARVPSAGRGLVISCDPDDLGEVACAEQIVREFTRRAWRRAISSQEFLDRMSVYGAARDAGGDWEEGIRTALRAVMLSPHFVYRTEVDPKPRQERALDGFELASRLSYFLWSSTPDDRLLDLAESGALIQPRVLEGEARRMFADPKAEALVDNLAGQWLSLRAVEEAAPSSDLYEAWNEGLRTSMDREVRAFVADILLGGRPLPELLTSDRTFVDAQLAEHYGVEVPAEAGLHEVRIPARRGLLGKGGLLAANSFPTRTSPVLRGRWVLDNLLCNAPPPPPAGVEGLDDSSDPGEQPSSLRERLELHRADPACAGCHEVMDQIGFAMEGFDATGRERTLDDDGLPINASGVLPGGATFVGLEELAPVLASDPEFLRCTVIKTFTYALGRAPETADAALLDELERELLLRGLVFEELAVQIVGSKAFRYRSGRAL